MGKTVNDLIDRDALLACDEITLPPWSAQQEDDYRQGVYDAHETVIAAIKRAPSVDYVSHKTIADCIADIIGEHEEILKSQGANVSEDWKEVLRNYVRRLLMDFVRRILSATYGEDRLVDVIVELNGMVDDAVAER